MAGKRGGLWENETGETSYIPPKLCTVESRLRAALKGKASYRVQVLQEAREG